jgi:group I intron endonuclease
MGWIYLILNKVNGKCYVGQTRQKNPIRRWSQHRNDPRGLLKKAITKHGLINFEFKILYEVSNEDLNDIEKSEIQKHNTIAPNGYNLQKGGECYDVHPLTREKQKSMWGLGHPLWKQKHTDETKQKISIATRGENNPMYGKKHSQEVIEKLRKNNHMNGKTGSLAPISKKVDAYSLDGEFLQTFDCIKEAAEAIGRNMSGIGNCLGGRSKTCGGFIWKYNKDSTC